MPLEKFPKNLNTVQGVLPQISIFRLRMIKYTTLNEKGQNGAIFVSKNKDGKNE